MVTFSDSDANGAWLSLRDLAELRELLEETIQINGPLFDGDGVGKFCVDVERALQAIASGMVEPDSNEGAIPASARLEQLAMGVVMSDGPWWVAAADYEAEAAYDAFDAMKTAACDVEDDDDADARD